MTTGLRYDVICYGIFIEVSCLNKVLSDNDIYALFLPFAYPSIPSKGFLP